MAYLGTKPANAVLTSEQIGDGVIATADLANGAVTQAKLASGVAGTGSAFSAVQSAQTSLSNNTYTKVLFGTEVFDTNNNFTSSSFTPTVAGYYQINAGVGTVNGQTTRTRLVLYKNGSQFACGTDMSSGYVNGTATSLIYMNGSTDFVEVYIYQSAGSAQNTAADTYNTYFNGALVRAA
jgi:hypothetical protein